MKTNLTCHRLKVVDIQKGAARHHGAQHQKQHIDDKKRHHLPAGFPHGDPPV